MTDTKPDVSTALLPFEILPRQTYRSLVLAVINDATEWRFACDIAKDAKLTYKQTIYALFALHNQGKIARKGRTFKASWGPLALRPKPSDNFQQLTALFNFSVRRK